MRVLLTLAAAMAILGAASGCSSAQPPPAGPAAPTTGAAEPTDVAVDRMEQVLTGTIERTGSCTVLVVGDRRLPLLDADSLAIGSRVTIRGSPVPVPEACTAIQAGQALRVTTVRPT